MIVLCDDCGLYFEDVYRSTVCPHNAFPANDGHNNFTVHEEAFRMHKTYAYHKPSSAGLEKIAELRQAFSALHDLIEQLAPQSREKAVAFTNLETTAMWAIKAVVCNDPESQISL